MGADQSGDHPPAHFSGRPATHFRPARGASTAHIHCESPEAPSCGKSFVAVCGSFFFVCMLIYVHAVLEYSMARCTCTIVYCMFMISSSSSSSSTYVRYHLVRMDACYDLYFIPVGMISNTECSCCTYVFIQLECTYDLYNSVKDRILRNRGLVTFSCCTYVRLYVHYLKFSGTPNSSETWNRCSQQQQQQQVGTNLNS